MTNTPKPEALAPCPFCNAELEKPSPVKFPKSGLARMHPGTTDDGSCPIAGWGFYDEQLANWNTRASDTTITTLAAALAWYGEQSRLARLIHSEGDAGRQALAQDGGTLARTTLNGAPQP